MEFSELRKELNNFVFQEVRLEKDDFFEAVVSKSELEKLIPVFEKFLGKPVFSLDTLPSEVQAMVQRFGGIMGGQSLYVNRQGGVTIFVMLWPWGCGTSITVKAGKE